MPYFDCLEQQCTYLFSDAYVSSAVTSLNNLLHVYFLKQEKAVTRSSTWKISKIDSRLSPDVQEWSLITLIYGRFFFLRLVMKF